MRLIKEIAFASALTLAALLQPVDAYAHEIKIGDLTISHPWSRQSPMGADVAAGFLTDHQQQARQMIGWSRRPRRSRPWCSCMT